MKPSEIFEILDMSMRARDNGDIFNPLFLSPPGLGKTAIVRQWCIDNNLPSVTLTLATLEPADLRGYPIIERIKDRQRMTTAAPDFWPDGGKGVIILEEVNRGTTAIMNCVMGLTDDRRGFDNYRLPDGYIVVGLINPETSTYDTNSMDPALKDRFEMFHVTYDKESLVKYARNKWPEPVVNFIETGAFSYVLPEDIKGVGSKYISPRTFSKLSAAMKAGIPKNKELMVYNEILGNNVGKDFFNFVHNESPVFYFDLANNTEHSLAKLKKFSDPKNFKSGMIALTLKDILENDISDDLLADTLKVLPMDQGYALLSDLEFKRKDSTLRTRIYKQCPEIKAQYKKVLTTK